ncbi:MAG: ATP-binding cassette domain-containing protein [Methylococcales symbiont of Iophon sp. n. MRB-2018]|nr:MAG: ATP-binding cassette domain-containing protein [Methylococcales symbiont of Iophon sp. n. MRB-2018]KAF3979364.1 MAG: ATP-binding cassette domain-containing protein [Methylococcales symbiont of Iophon sp. n. MRB-2018]
MPLLRLSNISIAYGSHALLQNAEFQLDPGERVALLGRNGEGKSTLMKIIAGKIQADNGEVWREPELKLAWLEQMPELDDDATIYDSVASGLGELGHWISQYHHLLETMDGSDASLKKLGVLQSKLETHNGWHFQQTVESTLSKLNLPADTKISSLSGGWKRRVALAQALVMETEVLLLDEPTNHLDFESIAWIEEQILAFRGAVLFVTHDRSFLQNLATRIVDLDRGQLVSWPGNYQDYLRRKSAALEDESNQNAEFDKKLAKEEVWIRQGIKARRSRNEGRVRTLKKLRTERSKRRNVQGTTKLNLNEGKISGKKVIEATAISFGYENNQIVKNFSTRIQRGDKIGLLGANGAGKTTLLKLLLKQLEPTQGKVEQGSKLQVAYFDQLREQLDPEVTVADTVADGSEFIEIGSEKKHVMSYLADFLFAPARSRSLVKSLSGGEKNRLLLARLFTKSANLIIMDEPTNDLDLETLEMLEDKLVNYEGTLLLVSHDRAFLDNVVTSVFVFEGGGTINEYIGGYAEWFALDKTRKDQATAKNKIENKSKKQKTKSNQQKLSFKDQKELDKLPKLIDQLEKKQAELTEQISATDFYKQEQEIIKVTLEQLQKTEKKLEQVYQRWDELESLLN